MKKLMWTIPLIAALVACGGGNSAGPLPQPHSPVIADPGPLTTPEFTTAVTKLSVTSPEGNAVQLVLSGPDARSFSITNDGSLRFALPPDYSSPADADRDNEYLITVTANDTYSTPTVINLAIRVQECTTCRVSNTSTRVTTDVSAFLPENIIASFEYPALMQQQTDKFVLTGAFASTTNWNNLEFANADLARVSARIGDASVSTCEIGGAGCDGPTGSITINDFTVTKDSITFLMSGGNGNNNVGVKVLYAATGQVLGSYTPNTCGDPVLKGNQHYVYFDTSALIGERVRLYIYDNETSGCGFIAFDHFYQTDQPRGVKAGVLSKPLSPRNVSLEGPVAIQKLIPGASFENPVDMVAKRGWVATGAFANPTLTSWQGTSGSESAAARVGDRAISTCEMNGNNAGCDASVGTLTSPAFQVTDAYLNFLMHGGGAGGVGLRVTDTLGNKLHEFVPTTCGPSRITNDDDWTHIDISVLQTAYVKAQLFDEQAGGCGFVSTDHWYQSGVAWNPSQNGKNGGVVALSNASVATLGFNVVVDSDAFLQVIGDFDDAVATARVWTATGDFANPTGADAWRGVSGGAKVGQHAVSTCEMNGNSKGCDGSTGTLTSPLFSVNSARPFLNFLMSGGSSAGTVGLKVLDSADAVIATYTPNSCNQASIQGEQNWVTVDLSAQAGRQVKVQIFDNESAGCGFVSFDHVYMGAARKKP